MGDATRPPSRAGASSERPLTLAPLVNQYVTERRKRNEITDVTARGLRNHLWHFTVSYGARPLDQLGARAVERYLESIGHLAPGTRRNGLSAVRYFCRWLVARKLIPVDPTFTVARIRQPRKVPRNLTADTVAALVAACADERERLVIELMVGCGCRAVEVSRLEVADIDRADRTVRVVGKGGHERVLPLPERVRVALDDYLATRGEVGGALIRSTLDPHKGVQPTTISGIARKVFTRAGVKQRPFDGVSPHALRSTCASDVLDRCGDLTVVKEMLGHANLQTTSIYLRRASLAEMRTAMEGRGYTTDDRADLDLAPISEALDRLVEDVIEAGAAGTRQDGRRLLAELLLT